MVRVVLGRDDDEPLIVRCKLHLLDDDVPPPVQIGELEWRIHEGEGLPLSRRNLGRRRPESGRNHLLLFWDFPPSSPPMVPHADTST